MTTVANNKVFISRLTHAARELLEISFHIDPNDRGKGYVKDVIFVAFTPSVENAQSPTGYSFDIERRETMSFNRIAIRALAAAMSEEANKLLLTPPGVTPAPSPSPYKKFTDSSKSHYNHDQGSGRKLLSIIASRHKDKSLVTLHYSGVHGQKVHIQFDPWQALGFAEELRWHADEISRQTTHFQQQRA